MLKNRLFLFSSVLLTAFLLSSCVYYSGSGGFNNGWGSWSPLRGSGNSVSEIRQVSGIRSVRLDNQGDLSITLGDTDSLVVEAEDNLLPYIRTEVRNGKLHIYNEGRNYFRNREPIRYFLTLRNLEGIEIGSTGSVNAPDRITEDFYISVSSTGNYEATDLDSNVAEVRLTSTGSAFISVNDYLEAVLNSTGSVHYSGEASTNIRRNSSR